MSRHGDAARALEGAPREPSEYRSVLVLGSGGMGRVELAVRSVGTFRRLYAVKRLHAHLVDDPGARSVLQEEARIAGSLNHPNVVGVIDVGEDANGLYLVMDYVEGLTLAELQMLAHDHDDVLPLEVACAIGLAIARALSCIHEAKDPRGRPLRLVHRDLSPRNVLVGFDGAVRLTDFGIARAAGRTIQTTTGLLKGTPGYVSPERLRFEEPDARSDLFSLGVVLYELLASERLYPGPNAQTLVRQVLEAPPPDIGEVRPETPPELVSLLFELLAKRPEDRPATAREVVVTLESVLAELQPEESGVSVAAYAGFVGADRRQLRRAEIERALSDASMELQLSTMKLSAVVAPQTPWWRQRKVLSAAALVGAALIGGGAAWLQGRAELEPSSFATDPAAATAAPVGATAAEERVPPAEGTSEAPDDGPQASALALAPEVPAETAEEVETEADDQATDGQTTDDDATVTEASAAPPTRRRRRRRRAHTAKSRGRSMRSGGASPMSGATSGFPREMDWNGELR